MLFRTRWRKVMRDLWHNRTRTALVVLSIAVGVFAVGMIVSSRIILADNLIEKYLATNPSHATMMTQTPFDEALVESIRNIEGVEVAEARRSVTARVENTSGDWINMYLIAVPDYETMSVSKIEPVDGAWPPPENEVLIERSSLGMLGVDIGDSIQVKTGTGEVHELPISGTSQDQQAIVYTLSGIAYGHISVDTLPSLDEPDNYNELHVRVSGQDVNREDVKLVMNEVQDKVEASGRTVLFTLIPVPDEPPTDYIIQAILAILGAIGVLALILSGFLVVNTISAILMQQTQQIGVMKAIGARRKQILPMYLVTVLMFGVLALIIAVPLAAVSAYLFASYMAEFLNFTIDDFTIPYQSLLLQLAVALLVPLVAGFFPVMNGTKITVQEAISDQGLGKGQFGTNIIDRFLTGSWGQRIFRLLTRPTLISIRNTFRRKKRLLLTLATLIMGGTIFVAVASVQASLSSTLNNWLNYYQYDVAVQMSRPYRVERVERALQDVPGVEFVEGWGYYTTRRVRPDGSDSSNITVFAPRPDTDTVNPSILEGRWLLPEDENAVVVNTFFMRDEDDVAVGDEVTLKIAGKESQWVVVGVAEGGTIVPVAFLSYEMLAERLGQVGRAEWFMVITDQHSAEYQTRMSQVIEDALTSQGFRVGLTAPAALDKQTMEGLFQIIVVLLFVMAIILALVGGLGLMGTMSINVLERTREIGVMRAVGASNRAILKIIIFEGMFIGGLSWIIGTLLAMPISRAISDVVGQQFLSTNLSYTFSLGGAGSWLVLVVILAGIASFLPAWNAARLTVREVLAYE